MAHGRPLFLALVLLVHWGATCSVARAEELMAEVLRIDSLCNKLDVFARDHKQDAILVVNIASYDDTVSQWVYFESDSLRNEAATEESLNEGASIWVMNDTPRLVEFLSQPGSGDWLQYVSCYYRDNGTLALVHSVVRTFHGDVNIDRTYWVGGSGTVLDSAVNIKDLASGRPFREEREYNDEPVPLYLNVSNLPFKPLLDSRLGGMR